MTSASDEKWRPFNCFSVQGIGGRPTGSDQENRLGDQYIGSPGRSVSSGLQVSGEQEQCPLRRSSLGDFPAAFFLQNVKSLNRTIRNE